MHNLQNPVTRERELLALQDTVDSVNVESILLLGERYEALFDIRGMQVQVQSVAEWLLEQEDSPVTSSDYCHMSNNPPKATW